MGKILVIAEKPAAGSTMAKLLGCIQKKDGYIEGNEYIVTWAIGHLIGLKYPEEHQEKYKVWKLEDLPFSFDIKDSLKILPGTSNQFGIIKNLINRNDIDMLINAGDAGREGYLIQSWIYRLAGNRKPIKVLWASSLTDEALRKAFTNLKDNKEFQGLLMEAEARAEGDHKLGINYSRALTLLKAGERTSLSYGRCQTPLLNLIVLRDCEIANFKPKEYYNVENTYIKGFKGILINEEKKKANLVDQQAAKEILIKCQGASGTVVTYEREDKENKAPLLLDLATLQKKMGASYGFTMDYTLELAQQLYEKRKILSYPRTDSRFLSTDLRHEIKDHLNCCSFGIFKEMIEQISETEIASDGISQYFNDKKVTDHHALIPTIHNNTASVYTKLSVDEKKVFDAIVLSFIAIFYPAYQYSSTEIIVEVNGNKFMSIGKTIRKLGYKSIYNGEENADEGASDKDKQVLPELEIGTSIKIDAQSILKGVTKPPNRYTVSTIVSLMEKYTIGTSATRAEIAKKLQNPKREFIKLEKGKYYATDLGKQYIEVLPEKLKAPLLTMQFEEKLHLINQGVLTKDAFLTSLDAEIRATIGELQQCSGERLNAPERANTSCPVCGKGNVVITSKVCFCSEQKNGCTLAVFRTIAGKKLTDSQIKQLLTNGKTGKIKGFTGKKGEFEASLILENGTVKFYFN